MPIYVYHCSGCGVDKELIRQMEQEAPDCCGGVMAKCPTFPAMVKVKGEGGYPSRRKWARGSAPYTTRATKEWSPANDTGLT